MSVCVCVCVCSSHLFWTSSSLDVPAGITREEGHTGFFIHLPSAVRALLFLARRIRPFLSLVDHEVEFCVLTILVVLHPLSIFIYLFFRETIPFTRIRTHVSTCQNVTINSTRLLLSYRGDRSVCVFFPFILDIKFVGRTSRGLTGGRSHRTSHPPSFSGACLYFSREKDSAIPFPRRPRSRILCTND